MKSKIFFPALFLVGSLSFACSDTSTSPDPNTETLATFPSIQATVFAPSCATSGCHNGTQSPNLSSRVAYDNIVGVQSNFGGLNYIEPNDPDNSYLFRKLTGSDISGSRMPRGASALSSERIDSIRVWIANGALEN